MPSKGSSAAFFCATVGSVSGSGVTTAPVLQQSSYLVRSLPHSLL